MHARCIPSAVSRMLSDWTISTAPIFDKLKDAALPTSSQADLAGFARNLHFLFQHQERAMKEKFGPVGIA